MKYLLIILLFASCTNQPPDPKQKATEQVEPSVNMQLIESIKIPDAILYKVLDKEAHKIIYVSIGQYHDDPIGITVTSQ